VVTFEPAWLGDIFILGIRYVVDFDFVPNVQSTQRQRSEP
jgi:hypothetical protein